MPLISDDRYSAFSEPQWQTIITQSKAVVRKNTCHRDSYKCVEAVNHHIAFSMAGKCFPGALQMAVGTQTQM